MGTEKHSKYRRIFVFGIGIFIMMTLSLPLKAQAANWAWVCKNNKMECYVDVDSIEYIQDNLKKAWVKDKRVDGTTTMTLWVINTKIKQYVLVERIYYDATGQLVKTDQIDSMTNVLQEVTPDSMGEAIYEYIRKNF